MPMINSRTVLTALLAAPVCAGFYLANTALVHVDVPAPTAQNRFWILKTFVDSAYDMVLMGDSRSYNGLSPEILAETEPGMRVLNFGYADGGFNPLIFRAAERKFAPDARRRILVLGVSPNSMTPKRGGRNLRYLEQHGKSPDYVFAHLRMAPFLSWFDSFEPAEMLDRRFTATARIRREYHAHGWLSETWDPPNPRQQLPFFIARFKDNAASKELADGLISQVGRWRSEGYEVFGFRPPNTPEMVSMEDSLSGLDYADLETRFREAGGTWFRFEGLGLQSFDGSHLDRQSAVRFSRAMRDSIAARLRPPAATAP